MVEIILSCIALTLKNTQWFTRDAVFFYIDYSPGGIGRSDGLFFLMFESRFNQSATLTAWPGALAGMLRLAMGKLVYISVVGTTG